MNTIAPDRTRDQMMSALAHANEIRVLRAAFKRNLRDGSASVLRLLDDPAAEFHSMKVFDLLVALPKLGRVKAARILNTCRVSQSKTVGGLSDRQRKEIADLLYDRGIR